MKSIYLSKLDESTTETMLQEHFSKFGNIDHIQMMKFPDGKCKGYGKIYTSEIRTYQDILRGEHIFNGISAKVEPFIENEQAAFEKDLDIVERRICVMGIPKLYNDTKFEDLFQRVIGDVEKAYVREKRKSTLNYGFVTFKSKETAKKALDMKIIDLKKVDGCNGFIQIKEFTSKGKERRESLEKTEKLFVKTISDNFIAMQNNNFLQAMLLMMNQGGFQENQPYPSQKTPDLFNQIKPQPQYFPIEAIIPDQMYNQQNDFLDSVRFKKYIEKIIEENPKIKKIESEKFKMLELFYFNQFVDERKYRLKNIANEMSELVEENQMGGNILIRIKRNKGNNRLKSKFIIKMLEKKKKMTTNVKEFHL